MNKETRTALNASIGHWRRIANGTEDYNGCNNCALCARFLNGKIGRARCRGCPVSRLTKQRYCTDTPLIAFTDYFPSHEDLPLRVFDTQSKALARAELNFLKALLPHG